MVVAIHVELMIVSETIRISNDPFPLSDQGRKQPSKVYFPISRLSFMSRPMAFVSASSKGNLILIFLTAVQWKSQQLSFMGFTVKFIWYLSVGLQHYIRVMSPDQFSETCFVDLKSTTRWTWHKSPNFFLPPLPTLVLRSIFRRSNFFVMEIEAKVAVFHWWEANFQRGAISRWKIAL